MFRTKKDVERHVADVLSKIDNENEKLLKGYTFARLFFQVKDYESAKKYLTGFLNVRHHHAASHKLMGQIYEATNNPENALQSFKRSLEVDSHQNDIILKICDLYCQVPVDHETARYWADRAEQLYPHHDILFKLRECLVLAEGEPDRQELEYLIASDLVAQPRNVDRRIKLLRLYLDTERVKEAYDHANMIENKQLYPYSVDWYYLLGDIFEAYQEDYQELDSKFYMNYLTALDHLVYLTLAEPHAFILENGKKTSSLNDAAAVLLTFDQLLKSAVQKDIREGSWTYFINHMKGQLYFNMASLLMKRAKMDQGNRKEAFRFSAGLAIVCYTFKPINILHEAWFSQMEDNQKLFTSFSQQGSLRTSFIGHVLLNLCKDDKSSWVQKIKTEVCIPQVKERIYSRLFSSLFKKEKLSSSYFISDNTFENVCLELPSEVSLKEYDKSAYKLCPSSLHHLVWLELHRENARISSHDVVSEIFKNLQYGNNNLSRGSCESLCVLDFESYLYATIYDCKIVIERMNNILNTRNDSLLSYPPDITDALCSPVQATWWKSAYGLYTSSIKEKLGEHRRTLQHGLEIIRGIGTHGMEVQLVIHLARMFSAKANSLDKGSDNNESDRRKSKVISETVPALYFRATHYWNIALGMLGKIESGKTLYVPKDPMFINSGKTLSKNEIKVYQEEGQLFLAVRLMNSDKLNDAAELLSKLSSPYGSYYLALTLKKLASQENKFSSAKTALLNKAKSSLLETMDRIKDDTTHPLNKELFIELEDVENSLAIELSIANANSCEDADETDAYDDSSIENFTYSVLDKSTAQSTPRPSSKFITPRHTVKSSQISPTKHFAPSPERLDAQVRALALNQDSLMKSFFQQQQVLLDTNKSIVEALQQNKEALEQLKKQLEEMSLTTNHREKFVHKAVTKKPLYLKTHGGGDEDEEYYDPSAILDYYEDAGDDYRASGYSFDRSSRIAHDPSSGASATLNYVVPPTLPPPGPPPLVNHFNYQYPPHGLVPTPPPAVPGRPTYYPPPGQGLPFNEGQQLPQFHFHVASTVGKPPQAPTTLTSLPQVVSGLPPPTVSVPPPPMTVALPHSVVPPFSGPNPWTKSVSVPHAFQIPLPTSSVIITGTSSLAPTITQVTPSPAVSTVTTVQSQLKDLLQTPPTTKTVTFGQLPVNTPASVTTSPSIFAGLNKTPETVSERPRFDSETATSPDIDGHDLEREVMGDFKPLIPLPAEIVVETGEENENVLFEDRAKLYRFIDQEWKERGIGVVKILHHEGSRKVRLLMRRDQVLKVCANHYIHSNMEIHPLKNSDKAWTWVASDFADEELRPEHFCIRFKTPEIAAVFKAAFEKAINISKETDATKSASPKISAPVTTSPLSSKPLSKFLPKPGSWTCPTCYVSNPGDKLLCIACETKKPGSHTSVVTPVVSTSVTSDFGGFKFGFPSTDASTINLPKNVFGGFTFTSDPVIQETEISEAQDREILVVSTKAKNGVQVTKVNTPKTSPFTGFTFKSPSITTVASSTSTISNNSSFFGFTMSNAPTTTSIPSSTVTYSAPFPGFSFPLVPPPPPPSSMPSSSFTNSTSLCGTTFPVPATSSKPSAIIPVTIGSSISGISSPSPTTTTTSFSPSASSVTTPTNISISSIQNLMQKIPPAFGFSKDPSKDDTPTKECVSSATNLDASESKFTLDTPTSDSEFVFGMKPITQPATFTFGLSALSNKSNETIGFKPTFSINNNTPATFGGATQKTQEKPDTTQNVNVFGSISSKTELPNFPVFGGIQKTEATQNTSVFGTAHKTEISSSIFNKPATTTEAIQSKSLFGRLPEKSETSKSTAAISVPAVTTSSHAVFNFGSSSEAKSEMGSVEFRFGSPQKYEFNFSGVRPRSPTKTPKSPATPSDVEEEEENESFDADNIYFQPVIPLPPKVDVKTGEENEKTIFCRRAKLFRFSSGEWRERGIGDFKLLYDESSKKIRLLMRRDQVLKVCLNHYLTKDIKFGKRGDKTLSWAATDFSENEPSPELFALRFKTCEFADECLAAIENSLKNIEKQISCVDINKAAASFSFKTDTVPKTESLTSRIADSVSSVFGTTRISTETSGTSAVSFSFKDVPTSSTFFKVESAAGDSNVSDLDSEGKDGKQTDDDEIQIVYEAVSSPEQVALAKKLMLPDTFFLYEKKPPCPGCVGCEDFVPPSKNAVTEVGESNTSVSETTPNTVSSTNTSTSIESDAIKEKGFENNLFSLEGGLSFADLASNEGFVASTSKQKKGFEGAGTPLFSNLNCSAETEGDEDTVAAGPDIHFEPVIPLPELITVKTGEEDETPIFTNRGKLFRFDPVKKEWKERGIGDLKILKHNEQLRFRIILRREQVHKIACNHCIVENMELSPLATSENALCWNAVDYSEGKPETSQFAIRFKNRETLEQFRQKFNECREILRNANISEVQTTTQVGTKVVSLEKENVDNNQNEHESSGSETNEDDEDSENESLFEKRVSFEVSEGDDNFVSVGIGSLKVIYDDSVFGYHVYMISDSGACLCDHIIAIQTSLRTEKKRATWAAIDLSVDPPRRRRFRASFSSLDAVAEFNSIFEEGKESALQSEIVEKDHFFKPTGRQS